MRHVKVDGVVVLYNPELSVLDNIASYSSYLHSLYVIDNSEQPDEIIVRQLKKLDNCLYTGNGNNAGVAWALNYAARLAIANGAAWLLTMDQDSKFEPDATAKLIDFALMQDSRQVGLVSPFHETAISQRPQTIIDEVLTTMTSGNIVSLAAFNLIGGFDTDYFIDALDWDYCLRLNLHKFKVLRLNNVVLQHRLGNPTYHQSPSGNRIVALNYNKTRRYYITRNKLLLMARYRHAYPDFCRQLLNSLKMDMKYICLYENNKAAKLHYMLLGIMAYYRGHRGKLARKAAINPVLEIDHTELISA